VVKKRWDPHETAGTSARRAGHTDGTGLEGEQIKGLRDGLLLKHQHHLSSVQRGDCMDQGVPPISPINRDAAGSGDERADYGDAEDGLLGEDPDRTAVTQVRELSDGEEIPEGRVVGGDHTPTAVGDVLEAAHIEPPPLQAHHQ
jgi:hypothetical protein